MSVLNAFRHQRFNTQTFRLPLGTSVSCAQRLSASEIQHRNPHLRDRYLGCVLNAFRHQRFNTMG